MARGGGVVVPIIADTSGLRKGVQGASSTLRRFGKTAALVAGAAALGGLAKTIQIGTQEFMEQQKVAAQTGAVLKSTGGIANVTSKQMENLSESLMRKSGVDDEAIQSGQNLLLTFTKIRNETGKGNDIFNQATKATLDLSVAMGKDLSSSAILVGKALNDPVKGATALSRAGVQLTKGQKDQIQAFVDSGRVLEAQKIILAELTTQFGGSAEAAGKTLPGQLNILKQTFSNLAGDLVSRFLPSLTGVAQRLTDFIGKFAAQPTLEAKVRFVIGSFGGLIWSGVKTVQDWWRNPKAQFEDNPANRLKVTIAPAGRDQAESFARDLVAKLNASVERFAYALGYELTSFIFAGARRGAAQQGERAGNSLVRSLIINTAAIDLGKRLVNFMFQGVRDALSEVDFSKILNEWARSQLEIAGGIGFKLGKELIDKFRDGAGRRNVRGLANQITATVREAVQSARETLAGLGAGLGGTLQTILGATFTRPGGMKPADILAEERKLEDERLALEEKRLTEAANAAEATEEDKLALREFYLNKEKTLRDRALEDEIQNRQRGINDLIESFNRGLISAQTFEQNLRGLIGADLGTELGIAFAGAFERELQTIVNTAKDIASVIGQGQPIAAGGGGVSSALKGENDRRFREALDDYEKRRAQRRKQAEDFRKRAQSDGGSKITDAEAREIREIMAKWDRENPKPKRADFGLALGGILNKQVFTAAEAGKEAIIPLDSGRGARMLRDALGTGGGSQQNIYLTVNAGLGTNPDELSQVIVNSIKRYEKRNGSVFQGPLVSVASNAAGVTSTDSGATTFNRVRSLRSG
jgi:hypothetical protein